MKQTVLMLCAWLLAVLVCVGCSSHNSAWQSSETPENDQTIVYSNLVDSTSQKEVAALLEQHGITQEQTDTLLSWADDFNSRVSPDALQEGFLPVEGTGVNYDGLALQSKKASDGTPAPEANCRLTSYLLLKQLIHTNGTYPPNDTILIFDAEAIDTYPPFHLSDEEQKQFMSLFSWVSVDGADTLEEHIDRIRAVWKQRNIQIDGEGISLITVYLDLPFDEVRFVGHTGVLLETEEGLLFVEKYGPQYPFQATKFRDRNELKRYLLSRSDLYGDETELAPIIMENDQLLS